MSKIGKNIRKIRTTKGLSQTEFGKLFGLTRGSIGSYEEGRAEPRIDTLLQIANKFSISLDEITSKDITVNQLSGFNLDFIPSTRPDTKINGLPLIASLDLLKNNGDYTKCASVKLIDIPLSLGEIEFFIQVDRDMKINGAYAEEGAMLLCGKPEIMNNNELGRLKLISEDLVWDLRNNEKALLSFPVFGMISTAFKRLGSQDEYRLDSIEKRLKIVESKLT